MKRRTVQMPLLWTRAPRYAPATAPPDAGSSRSRSVTPPVSLPSRAFGGVRAPVSWSVQTALLAARAAVVFAAESVRDRNGRRAQAVCAMVAYAPLAIAEARLETAQARAVGLTEETAPRLVVDLTPAVQLVFALIVRLRGLKVGETTAAVDLAQHIIIEIDRRRSWRAALAAGAATTRSRTLGW
jgi:hypothetical protein